MIKSLIFHLPSFFLLSPVFTSNALPYGYVDYYHYNYYTQLDQSQIKCFPFLSFQSEDATAVQNLAESPDDTDPADATEVSLH